jgi:hypothetical protein
MFLSNSTHEFMKKEATKWFGILLEFEVSYMCWRANACIPLESQNKSLVISTGHDFVRHLPYSIDPRTRMRTKYSWSCLTFTFASVGGRELMNEPRSSCDIWNRNASCEAPIQQTINVASFFGTCACQLWWQSSWHCKRIEFLMVGNFPGVHVHVQKEHSCRRMFFLAYVCVVELVPEIVWSCQAWLETRNNQQGKFVTRLALLMSVCHVSRVLVIWQYVSSHV